MFYKSLGNSLFHTDENDYPDTNIPLFHSDGRSDIPSPKGSNQAQDTIEPHGDKFERAINNSATISYFDPATGRGFDAFAEKPISQMIGFKDGKPEFIYMTIDEYYEAKEVKESEEKTSENVSDMIK